MPFASPVLSLRRSSGLVAVSALLTGTAFVSTAAAQATGQEPEVSTVAEVVVTAARTVLPASALPMTVDVIDRKALSEQVAISGSVIDAVATLSPSFSPTRQKLPGSGESLRGRSPCSLSTAFRSRRRSATVRATAIL